MIIKVLLNKCAGAGGLLWRVRSNLLIKQRYCQAYSKA